MRKYLIPLALFAPLALGSCSTSAVVTSDVTACTQALLAAGTINPATLLSIATSNPACIGLATDIINGIITNVTAQQKARGIRS